MCCRCALRTWPLQWWRLLLLLDAPAVGGPDIRMFFDPSTVFVTCLALFHASRFSRQVSGCLRIWCCPARC